MFCHKCGHRSPEGSAFCQKCGAKLITDDTPQAVSAPTKPQMDTPRKKKSKKLPIVLGVVAVVIVAIIVVVKMTGSYSGDYPGEILQDGLPVTQLLGMTRDDVIAKLGEPELKSDEGAPTFSYNSKGILLYFDESSNVVKCAHFDTSKCTLNGSKLERKVEQITEVLAQPYREVSIGEPWNIDVVRIEYNDYTVDFEIYNNTLIYLWVYTDEWSFETGTEQTSGASASASSGGSRTEEVLYNGESVINFLGQTIDGLSGVLGSPLGDNYAGMGHYYEYDDLTLYADDATNEVTDIMTVYPHLFDVGGATLDKNATELADLLGTPTYQGEQEPGGIYYGYEVIYELDGHMIAFMMTSPEGTTRAILLSRTATAGNSVTTESSNLERILYKGEAIIYWMGSGLANLRDVFGEPDAEGIVGEGSAYGFRYEDGTAFVKREQGEDIEYIIANPSSFSVDGVTLDTNRDQLVRLLGEPDSEGWINDYGTDAYYVKFIYQGKYAVWFTLDDPNGKAYDCGINE